MKAPKVSDSLSWQKRKNPEQDAGIIHRAASRLNKFANDGNFMSQFLDQASDSAGSIAKEVDQLQARVLKLRLKGKHEEADELMKGSEQMKENQNANRYVAHHSNSIRRKQDNDDANQQYSLSSRADDEYDFEGGPRKRSRKVEKDKNASLGRRIVTQQQRCLSCFENPNRSKESVLSIANFTYLALPETKPVHESSTRSLDDKVWEEIRNFKKCLIMMFAKQDKEVVFLETVMHLAKQRSHCLVECIPLPRDVAEQAPVYFKKAIDEAEDELTAQHSAKRLIDTSVKGLRGSIPDNFPYFHVEFGLKRGFVHVIEDESRFDRNIGLNVIRGMMRLPEEDMYRCGGRQSVEGLKLAAAEFGREWHPFDWTRELVV
ncbi:CWF19-like protein 2 [Linum grandiflorum]